MHKEETTPEMLSRQERAVVVAAAGCGKTHLIAETVKYTFGRQLILTHTHAGVHSIRNKLTKLGIKATNYRVETIAGFALRYASAYPVTCGFQIFNEDESVLYENLYNAAYNVINNQSGRRIISVSYSGLFVDEYQDCTQEQHKLILLLSEIIPTRILGDELQGIFDFAGEIVDWDRDVFPVFTKLPNLSTPWRWKLANKYMGIWIKELREKIIAKEPICLSDLPNNTTWHKKEWSEQITQLLYKSNGTTVGIIDIDNKEHKIANYLKGYYNSMEEIERRTLFVFLKKFEQGTRKEKILELFGISTRCMTKVGSEFKTIINCVENNRKFRGNKHQILFNNIETYIQTGHIILINEILKYIGTIEGVKIYRKELWSDINKLFSSYALNPNERLVSLAHKQIEMYSVKGCRQIYYKTISRPFLIKGLEFNHAILLDADALKPKELYVALTRGSNYLTILSEEPVLRPKYYR
jgi:DNA helicase-2/ATP-dependent DNA helicase PcrA